MVEDFYDHDDLAGEPKRKDNLFLWTVFILILIGLALACWIGSFYVFGHPERPGPYRWLQWLGKIDPVRRFEVTAAPQGEFLTAQKLFERYSSYTPLELERENAELMRSFVKNYAETKRLVPYVRGRFEVADAYELKPSDMFQSGTVALMQAEEFPQVLLEHLFPATGSNLEQSKRLLSPGYPFNVEKTNDVTAVIHVARVFDGRLLFTVAPLHYPSYALKGGAGTFTSEPPKDLHIEAGVPVLKAPQIDAGLKKLAMLHGGATAIAAATPETKKTPELARVDTPPEEAKVPETRVAAAVPVAPVRPEATARGTPSPGIAVTPPPPVPNESSLPRTATVPAATPAPLAMLATPVPRATPTPETTSQGVPLKPFLRSNQAPGLPTESGGSWRTYAPGQLPQGRAVTPAEVRTLADRGDLGERVYLRGAFVVTASGENKAVLRPQGADEAPAGSGPIRVIVDYPSGAVPPEEGASFARDSSRGFQVVDVRRGGDGTVNVFVREVAQP